MSKFFFLSALLLLSHIFNPLFCQTMDTCTPADRFDGKKLVLSEEEWKKRLTPEQFKILRKAGTEPAFKNAYAESKEKGVYVCAGCSLPLYSSEAKYDSGTGWPSFWQPLCPENVS